MPSLPILKTYKIYIGGQFPRTESGRYFTVKNRKQEVIGNLCLSSRKDFRNAVVAARSAFEPWSTRSAYNRSQILYRVAEMLEGRFTQFTGELVLQGMTAAAAKKDVRNAIDTFVYYAGWCDKYQQLFSAVNPVSSPHYNFSMPEPMGVVSVIAPDEGLYSLVSMIAPVIAGANTCVVLASSKFPLTAITFCEALATSDLPAGVVNVLTGTTSELLEHFASHMDVNALVYARNDKSEKIQSKKACATNVKRYFDWGKSWSEPGPYRVMDLQEIKTTWHPVENGIGGSGGY